MDKTIFTKSHKDLVAKLIKARKALKLKQSDVAKALRRTQSYISKIEAGQRRLDIVQLNELAAAYKKNLRYFIE
ncbi:MAG: helix-turn-helix transcriptional regulator [Candidatus Omnitrophota bacterium]